MLEYDTNLKVSPPLRSQNDLKCLRTAVLDGTIDCIASHHVPHHTDHKVVEFEYAKNGMIGLETAFGVVRTALPQLPMERLIELIGINPRKIFGLPQQTIQINQPASLSLFLPNQEWIPQSFHSKSRNSPFFGKALTGQPLGIINKDSLFLRP